MLEYNKPIIETIPNFSEGRDIDTIEYIVDSFRDKAEVKLLNYSADPDHNRMVITAAGSPGAITDVLLEATGRAVDRIDMTKHVGAHPRIGAVDVVPFVPINGLTLDDAAGVSSDFAEKVSEIYGLPVYLYEHSARFPERKALEKIRKRGFEGLREKMSKEKWRPDFGLPEPHPTAGAVVVGARMPLIAFNVDLNTTDIAIANIIARKIRASNGGIPCLKAIGVALPHKNRVQVSMNITDYTRTPLYVAYEAVRKEAELMGIDIVESELIGLVPAVAMAETAAFYLSLPIVAAERVVELRIME